MKLNIRTPFYPFLKRNLACMRGLSIFELKCQNVNYMVKATYIYVQRIRIGWNWYMLVLKRRGEIIVAIITRAHKRAFWIFTARMRFYCKLYLIYYRRRMIESTVSNYIIKYSLVWFLSVSLPRVQVRVHVAVSTKW